jgi:hypothetical protein
MRGGGEQYGAQTQEPKNTLGNAPGMGISPLGRSLAAGMMAVRGPVAAP